MPDKALPRTFGTDSAGAPLQLRLKRAAGLQLFEALCALEEVSLISFLIGLGQLAEHVLLGKLSLGHLVAVHHGTSN
jgi:hypothetical protein